jgi:hypothetical protein
MSTLRKRLQSVEERIEFLWRTDSVRQFQGLHGGRDKALSRFARVTNARLIVNENLTALFSRI